jgi:hypothetical protein
VQPTVVVEFAANTSVDEGRSRHQVRYPRIRDDTQLPIVPPFGA